MMCSNYVIKYYICVKNMLLTPFLVDASFYRENIFVSLVFSRIAVMGLGLLIYIQLYRYCIVCIFILLPGTSRRCGEVILWGSTEQCLIQLERQSLDMTTREQCTFGNMR